MSELSGKLLHIIGGGANQIPLLKVARDLGLRVLVTDMYDDPPCRKLADAFEKINTTDKEGTLNAAIRHKIDAVVSDQTDPAVPTTAYVAENLGLTGIGYETALRFTNKYLMREALKGKLPSSIPEYFFFDDPAAATAFCEAGGDPSRYLVKPVNAQGSKGVSRLPNARCGVVIANAFLESKSRGVLVEQFLEGFEYSVEAYKDGDRVHNLAVTKKYHYIVNDCIDERNTYLGDISPELESKLFRLNAEVIRALDLPFGITHAEYKFSDEKPYLIEIAARGGGGGISSKIIPYLTGFMPARALILRLFGKREEIAPGDYKSRFAVMKFFNFRPGRIRRIHVNRSVTADLLEFQLSVHDGDEIRPIRDSRDRPGYFVVAGTDRDAILEREKQVEAAVQIEYEE